MSVPNHISSFLSRVLLCKDDTLVIVLRDKTMRFDELRPGTYVGFNGKEPVRSR